VPSSGGCTLSRVLGNLHDAVSAIRDLGVPGLAGTALGASLSYVFGRRLLDDQADRDQKRLAAQVERDAADRVETALHQLFAAAQTASSDQPPRWGQVHNQWQDTVLRPASRIRDRELQDRIEAVGQAIFTTVQFPDAGLSYGVLHSIENATAGLRAFLAFEPLPPAFFPTRESLRRMLWDGPGQGPHLDVYREWLAAHPSTVY
jgi:hypothetical protein